MDMETESTKPDKNEVPGAAVLGQLLLMQSILCNLPGKHSIHQFICRGLLDIPGVKNVAYSEVPLPEVHKNSRVLDLIVDSSNHGLLLLELSDTHLFAPYEQYLKNFCFMVAVILEERRKRRKIEEHQIQLEETVAERTTELRVANEKLQVELAKQIRTDKLDSIGILAGGIAHDFNNLLSGIFGFLDLASQSCSITSRTYGYLKKAQQVNSRAKDLTRQLLTFSKGGAPEMKPGNLASIVRDNALFALSGSNVAVQFDLAGDLWVSDFDENQMGQVLNNLVINAQHAMRKGGTIVITAENKVLDADTVSTLPQGEYIKLSVIDTGTGIPIELVKNIFDPFFTTKKGGSGLGLATSYSIIRKHNGGIDVESAPGKGTTFYIYLPRSKFVLESLPVESIQSHRGSGKILVMDDQDILLDIAREMLEIMGYEVMTATDGDQALGLLGAEARSGKPFNLAIFDLTIPGGKGGIDTLIQMREMGIEIPVVATSGYSVDPVMATPDLYGFVDSIKKPYISKQLKELLNRLN
ncbi:MAG: response regulator [bacterium]|nr:response regulator [bacterium]